MKVIIVGGVAGGASTAARLRRLDESAQIILLERGGAVSYSNCGLPYYIGGVVQNRDDLLLQTPQSFWDRFHVEVRIFSEAVSVDPAAKTVRIRRTDSGEAYTESYDKLVLAPGAEPLVPPIPGGSNAYTLRTIEDAARIKEAAAAGGARKAVVIGGGFIGLEMAENLRKAGLDVVVAEGSDQLLPPLDPEMAAIAARELERNGIQVLLQNPVKEIRPSGGGYQVLCGSQSLPCDFAVMAIGVRPESTLAVQSGLKVNARKGIVVDEMLRTSAPDIFAAGDAVEKYHLVSREPVMLPLAGPANRQGRVIADNLSGMEHPFDGVIGSAVCKLFHVTAACTGLNEKTLKAMDRPYEKVYLSPSQHVGVYPGASPITMKLLFSPDGTVLGCQCIGEEGVDKRVDVISTVIKLRGSVSDLARLELCYAPPYSSPRDPVNYAGLIAENVLSGLSPIKHWHDLAERDQASSILVDVRTQEEYAHGHLEGSINIPVGELRDRIDSLPRNRELWIYCQVGLRGYIAQRMVMQLRPDQKVYNLSGGYRLLSIAGLLPEQKQNQ